MTLDAWRLSVGMFTVWPVKPPQGTVDQRMGRWAILLAPLGVMPLALAAAATVWVGALLGVPSLVIGVATVAVIVLGNRAFHLDGLADTVDALAVTGDADRANRVRKSGDIGPAGTVSLVLVLLAQSASVAALASHPWAPLVVAGAVSVSRASTVIGCSARVPAASTTGLGATHAATIPVWVAALIWMAATGVMVGVGQLAGIVWWRSVLAMGLSLLAVLWLLRRSVERFGGMVGDVLGASVEVTFTIVVGTLA